MATSSATRARGSVQPGKGSTTVVQPSTLMTLGNVKSSREDVPDRFFGYGPEGVGKSMFGAGWPKPIFLSSEDGIHHLDVMRFPEPKTWADVMAAFNTLLTEKHDYQTLVIDTIDWVEQRLIYPMAKMELGATSDKDAEDYGRWIKIAVHYHRQILDMLARLRKDRKMHAVVLAHSKTKNFSNPNGPDYGRFVPAFGGDLGYEAYKQWADTVAFLHFGDTIVKVKGKEKGSWDGARLMETLRSAAYDAKSRYDVDETLALDYVEYARQRDSRSISADKIEAEFAELVKRSGIEGDELATMRKWFSESRGDARKMRAGINRLKKRVKEKLDAEAPKTEPAASEQK